MRILHLKISFIACFALYYFNLIAQTTPFNIHIEPMDISGLGGLQSYAYGQHEDKWLIVGGRLDGLHRRQPFAAFDIAGNNNQLLVIDPVSKQKWTAPLTSLPTAIREQLSSTNMQFYQEGDYLYCTGGYGYSPTLKDHTTYSNLTAIKVSDVVNAIIAKKSFISYFRQISDLKFQVTGGRLEKINKDYYLLGGQKFIGRYNPMGPDHGPGFIQEYTNAIRKFNLNDDGKTLKVMHLPSYIDSANLHRRDYNAEPQILPNGKEGITMFSGVFQHKFDLPFLNSVNIDSENYKVNNDFQQYYNHYHCGSLPMYSETNNEMHNVFFGGIAQYFDSLGILVQDNNVPFTKTIARVTRDKNNKMAEYKLPIEMPSLLGAGAEFISNKSVPHFSNNVIKFDKLTTDSTLVGYIYGGISSTAPNIFFTNTGAQSSTSSQIFKVYVIKNSSNKVDVLNKHSISSLKMQVFPNPSTEDFTIKFYLEQASKVSITIQDSNKKLISKSELGSLKMGDYYFPKKIKGLTEGDYYFITLENENENATLKVKFEN